MAFTSGTTNQMKPLTPPGGAAGVATTVSYAGASGIAIGDVIVYASSKAAEDNSLPAGGTILGVSLGTSAAAEDPIVVAMALPGVLFEANIIAAITTDQTGVFTEDIGVKYGLIAPADGFACIDISNTTEMVAIGHRYGRQTNTTQDSDPLLSGVGVTNPRVVFSFLSGVFFDIA